MKTGTAGASDAYRAMLRQAVQAAAPSFRGADARELLTATAASLFAREREEPGAGSSSSSSNEQHDDNNNSRR